jgi:hypothetical protein
MYNQISTHVRHVWHKNIPLLGNKNSQLMLMFCMYTLSDFYINIRVCLAINNFLKILFYYLSMFT